MNDQVRKIMEILEDELETEIQCLKVAEDFMKRYRYNPIRRITNRRAKDMFIHHVAALSCAIGRIKKELNLKD